MIRVLHLSNAIHPFDFIDTAISGLDRKRFRSRALTVVEASNRILPGQSAGTYEVRCLNIPFQRRALPLIYREFIAEIRSFRPHIVHVHHYDEALLGVLAKMRGEIDVLVVGHHYSKLIHMLSFPKRNLYLSIENFRNRIADAIAVPSEEVVEVLRGQGVDPGKIRCIPYAMDPKESELATEEGAQKIREEFDLHGKKIAIAVGRLDEKKGLEFLLQAVPDIRKVFPEFVVCIIGSGPDDQRLRKIARNLGIEDAVIFTGSRSDVMSWYLVSDIVVHPSVTESFCQIIVEALSVGRAVVMTPVGVAPEIIIPDKRGGELVAINSSESIVASVLKLLKNPELAKQLAAEGRTFVEKTFTKERTAKLYSELYEELLGDSPVTRRWIANETKVSVVIPNYNYGRFIQEAVRSVLAQTRVPDEVIVVDDGSTDDSIERLAEFGDRIQVIRQAQSGVGVARNVGARASSGNVIAFLDSDDIWMPDKLERQLALLESDSSIGMVTCNMRRFGNGSEREIFAHRLRTNNPHHFLLMNEDVVVSGSAIMLRRELFDELGGFDESRELHPSEDWEFFYRVMRRAQIVAVEQVLVKYRSHGANGSANVLAGEQSMYMALSKILNESDEIPRSFKRRCWANLHTILAGGFFKSGQFGRFMKHAFLGVVYSPERIMRYIGYPIRVAMRHRRRREGGGHDTHV